MALPPMEKPLGELASAAVFFPWAMLRADTLYDTSGSSPTG